MEPPSKRTRLLSDESSSENDESAAEDLSPQLLINEEYAKRFEHNKKREELHRLQEKYPESKAGNENGQSDSESDSESESEDDVGELATTTLDAEIQATLEAIRARDPRVYDPRHTFFKPDAVHGASEQISNKDRSKPLRLQDYHRKNLLEHGGMPVEETITTLTQVEQDAAFQKDLLKQMHEARGEDGEENGSGEEEMFVRKPGQTVEPPKRVEPDVAAADQDPEKYLSDFMASRAWIPTRSSRFQPFESDDEDDDKADQFEAAYNLRFEDPAHANETLTSHSREAAAKYSVRREEPKGRKRARETKQMQRDAEKAEREEEKARLRKLKVEEAEKKLSEFKRVAGLKENEVPIDEWASFLEAGWDDEKWDAEMAKRFGDHYYAEDDSGSEEQELEADEPGRKRKRVAKKPKWEDDIEIGDIDPDFDKEEQAIAQTFTLSDEDSTAEEAEQNGARLVEEESGLSKESKQSRRKESGEKLSQRKRQARKERQKIEELVDQSLLLEEPHLAGPSKSQGPFRYRETSPTAYGLSAREILMADDSQLNQFAGLKKLASFRDAEKKKKDKRKLSKKARLRQWRKDTFGDENGPTHSLQDYIKERMPQPEPERRPKDKPSKDRNGVARSRNKSGRR